MGCRSQGRFLAWPPHRRNPKSKKHTLLKTWQNFNFDPCYQSQREKKRRSMMLLAYLGRFWTCLYISAVDFWSVSDKVRKISVLV